MLRYFITFGMILLAAFSRVLPHPPNFAPITALALFGAVYLDKKHTFVVPIAAMLISDYFIGFYTGMVWVYASFVAIGFIGLWLRNHPGVMKTIGSTLAGSVLFFVVTNFGVWISSQVTYPHTIDGIIACYLAAVPFFRNTVLGDVAYVGAMFGTFALVKRFLPSLSVRATPTQA